MILKKLKVYQKYLNNQLRLIMLWFPSILPVILDLMKMKKTTSFYNMKKLDKVYSLILIIIQNKFIKIQDFLITIHYKKD